MSQSDIVRISPSTLHQFTSQLLIAAGVPQEHAEVVAECLVLADLRGVDTHGVNRLPGYLARIRAGSVNTSPQLSFVSKSLVVAHLDAQSTFGFVAASHAIDKAVEMARTYGFGIVGVRNSGHYGMAATYLLKAISYEMGAMAFTNASPTMPAWGSKQALLGTSPLAVGLPGRDGDHWLLDMSPAVVARVLLCAKWHGFPMLIEAQGKIRKAERRGEAIPEGWALDAEGRITTDATAALSGVVLPIGGPKGSGLAMMMDIFSGIMTGANFAGDVIGQYAALDKAQGVGHWFMVFRPDMFLESMEEYYERMAAFMEKVRDSEKASGVEKIYMPGEIEFMKEKENRARGTAFTRAEVETLHRTAADWGCEAQLTA
jgi:LDH2 family malate/lactate/ureidoglycolate dehydrogenase